MHIVVLVTAKDTVQAKKISKALVDERLVACSNVVKGVQSFFYWEGKMDCAREVLLILKTTKKAFPQIVKRIRNLHSYQTPEIIALPIVCGEKSYLNWITESVNN